MRTSEARVEEMHCRMEALKRAKARRAYIAACASVCLPCLILTVMLALAVSRAPVQKAEPAAGGAAAASIFTDGAAFGYVLVGVVSLCLGVLVTVLCFRLRRRADGVEERDDRKV